MKSQLLAHLRRCNNSLRESSFKTYKEFLLVVCRSSTHERFQDAYGLVLAERWTDLIELADSLTSTAYSTAAEHRLLNQLAALIRKYPFPENSVTLEPRRRALETFVRSERKCKLMNRKFRLFSTLRSPNEVVFARMRSWISYVLGEFKLADVWDDCGFGPGASIGVNGNASNNARKFLASSWTVSPSAFYYACAAMSTDFHAFEFLCQRLGVEITCLDIGDFNSRFRSRAKLVDYNKITFVPKTAKTERTIAVEPLLNGYLQKGVDVVMRKRLMRVGIDLTDQSRNQRLALAGSVQGNDPYVTIDLSSASDSICTELCRHVLPPDWFDFMNATRSRSYSLDGVIRPSEKFATMGNGFCFPLETLIFASLCQVAYDESHLRADYSVYGDDIIVRQSVATRVLALLKYCGFRANPDKTFITGPFRESCGADWFEGEDVRPITLDYAFDSVDRIFTFLNLIRSKVHSDVLLSEAREFLISKIDPRVLFVRPLSGQDDTALEVPFDTFMTSPFSKYDMKNRTWSWIEVQKTICPDKGMDRMRGYASILMRGAMTGVDSLAPFAVRRKAGTKIRRIAYSSTSSWVPV